MLSSRGVHDVFKWVRAMENDDPPERQGLHCQDIHGALHRAPPFSPKKSLAALVEQVTPRRRWPSAACGAGAGLTG